MKFILSLCICGYHVYGEEWTATLEELTCEREIGNVVNQHAKGTPIKQFECF